MDGGTTGFITNHSICITLSGPELKRALIFYSKLTYLKADHIYSLSQTESVFKSFLHPLSINQK
jgi:hypothetical protein